MLVLRYSHVVVSSDALKVSAELLKLFVVGMQPCIFAVTLVIIEAFHRAAEVARSEGNASVKTEHLEKILPQLLLDF